MRRDWETRLEGEPEHNSRMKTCAEISKEATPEDKKEVPVLEEFEEVHIKSRTTPNVDFAKREAIKGVQTYGFGSNLLWRSIRQEKTVP
jgi:hypothetical protein